MFKSLSPLTGGLTDKLNLQAFLQISVKKDAQR